MKTSTIEHASFAINPYTGPEQPGGRGGSDRYRQDELSKHYDIGRYTGRITWSSLKIPGPGRTLRPGESSAASTVVVGAPNSSGDRP